MSINARLEGMLAITVILTGAAAGCQTRPRVTPAPAVAEAPAAATPTEAAPSNAVGASGAQPSPIRFAMSRTGLPTEGMWKCDPLLKDLNGDGAIDLAGVPRKGDGPRVWFGDGAGNWRESSKGLEPGERSCGGGIEAGDLNKDGRLDLAVADHCQGVFLYLGKPDGSWELAMRSLHPAELVTAEPNRENYIGAEDIDIGDVNQDGNLDLVSCATDEGGIALFLGDGTGRNWRWHRCELPTTGWANRVRFAKIDRGDSLDILASFGSGLRVWLGDGSGQFTESSAGLPTPLVHGLYTGIDVADVNHDGLADLAAANSVDGPEIYLQQSNGSWKKTADVFPEMLGGAYGLALGDVNADGHVDMAVTGRLQRKAGYVYGVFCLLGNGPSGWRFIDSGLPSTGLAYTFGVALADCNNDRLLDIAAGGGGIVATDRTTKEQVPAGILLLTASKSESVAEGTAPGR